MSDIRQNLKRIEEYRNFPDKLQKYITWKDRLMYEILCNIEAIEKMTFGWIKENGVRFQRWAELFVLIKAIAESWQPIVDIFATTSASCGVCRNERHNSQYWKFKLISMLIPTIPVIAFPKWPDIVLDLSDIRLGMSVTVPDFNFRISNSSSRFTEFFFAKFSKCIIYTSEIAYFTSTSRFARFTKSSFASKSEITRFTATTKNSKTGWCYQIDDRYFEISFKNVLLLPKNLLDSRMAGW